MTALRGRAASRPRRRPDLAIGLVSGAVAGAVAALDIEVALAAVGAVCVAVLLLVGADLLLYSVLAVEPWTDALNFPTSSLTIPKIVGLLAIGSWAMLALTGRTTLRFTAQMGWAFAFLAVVVISFMLTPQSGGTSKTISYTLYVLLLALFVQTLRDRRAVERGLKVYAGAIVLGTFYGLGTFIGGSGHLASGPISDPNNYASTLAGGLTITAWLAARPGRWQWLWRIGLLLVVATLLATLSRGALVGFGAVLVWGVLTGRVSAKALTALAVTVVLGLAVGLIFFGPVINNHLHSKSAIATTNVTSREAFWSAALRMAENHPLFGVGPAGFGDESSSYIVNDPIVLNDPYTHNSFLEILAEDGIFAVALYLAFIASTWQALRKVRRRAAETGDADGVRLADALMAAVLWTAVSMFFISRQLAIPLWLFAGVAGALVLAQSDDARAPSVAPVRTLGEARRPALSE